MQMRHKAEPPGRGGRHARPHRGPEAEASVSGDFNNTCSLKAVSLRTAPAVRKVVGRDIPRTGDGVRSLQVPGSILSMTPSNRVP